ncbi:MAG: M3 family peptidase [Caulobacteraceae bacterium]|nr:MAG: M3 family peptidase [Caulobacteraceae bacterium]
MDRRSFLASGAALAAVASARAALAASDNPLLVAWAGAYGGLPPFDKVRLPDFEPAYREAMALQRAELKAITDNRATPTFENTILAYERSGQALGNVGTIYGVHTSVVITPEMQAIEERLAPVLAAYADEQTQNTALFARIDAVYQARETAGLTPEQQRLAWVYHNNFVQSGARLNAADKTRLAAINLRLADLYTAFSKNLLSDENGDVLVLDKAQDTAGLPASVVAAARAAAERRKLPGRWVIENNGSAMNPMLTFSIRRDLRQKAWEMRMGLGDHTGGPTDNKPVIREILKLRAERSKLLGYPTFAHWRVADRMARTPENAIALMEALLKPAIARMGEEVADMKAIAAREGDKAAAADLQPWDYRHYAEKVRKAKYDIDEAELKPYLQLDRMKEAMFWVAGQVYGLSFKRIKGVPVPHPDIETWEVRGPDGRHRGVWYFDAFARPEKQSGAWCSEYRSQGRFPEASTVLVSNNCNFTKPPAGQPCLLSWSDVTVALFHEFGHAIHALNSDVTYRTLAGANVTWDYVEFPSQIMERWALTPEVLSRFALHATTGKPMPKALADKLRAAKTFNQGFLTARQLSAAMLDMKLHLAGDADIDLDAFYQAEVKRIGLPKEAELAPRLTWFSHVFSGESYAAGYYSYAWAETLTADAWEVFLEAGGPYDKAVGKRLHDTVMSVGNTVSADEAFRNFRGRDVRVAAILRDRGFPVPA